MPIPLNTFIRQWIARNRKASRHPATQKDLIRLLRVDRSIFIGTYMKNNEFPVDVVSALQLMTETNFRDCDKKGQPQFIFGILKPRQRRVTSKPNTLPEAFELLDRDGHAVIEKVRHATNGLEQFLRVMGENDFMIALTLTVPPFSSERFGVEVAHSLGEAAADGAKLVYLFPSQFALDNLITPYRIEGSYSVQEFVTKLAITKGTARERLISLGHSCEDAERFCSQNILAIHIDWSPFLVPGFSFVLYASQASNGAVEHRMSLRVPDYPDAMFYVPKPGNNRFAENFSRCARINIEAALTKDDIRERDRKTLEDICRRLRGLNPDGK